MELRTVLVCLPLLVACDPQTGDPESRGAALTLEELVGDDEIQEDPLAGMPDEGMIPDPPSDVVAGGHTAAPACYRYYSTKTVGGIESDSVTRSCPSGTTMTGGGHWTDSSNTFIMASYPSGSSTWYVKGFNPNPVSRKIRSWVRCCSL